MLRLTDNPPTEHSAHHASGLSEEEWAGEWRVAFTKSRQEKRLAHDLMERGVSYFLPMTLRETSSGGRRRRNMYPIFPSYLFFTGGDDARLSCLKTDRVAYLIEPTGEEQHRLKQELRSLATVFANDASEIGLYETLIPGREVRVKSGPLRDVEGTIIESGNIYRLQLAVSLLGVGVVVEIHPDLVELL